ncbi:MAG: TIGR01906 family membrane protein [Candidatus Nanoarchaeia archaeon]|nr:TIGR01906 family membrane protein [Candidatus Nanoarchaeia archaeon]
MKIKLAFVLLVFVFVFLLAFQFEIFNLKFYEKEFIKNNVYDKFGKEQTLEQTNNLIDYFNGKYKVLGGDFFNDKEKVHLEDVKFLINLATSLFYLSFLAIVLYVIFLFKTDQKEKLRASISAASFLIIFVVLLLIFSNFSALFLDFHKILFTNDLWLLNPLEDNLIVMFPAGFFYDIFLEIILDALIITLTLILINTKILNNVKFK